MFETLTNLNLIKLLTTTDELSIKHITNNERMAHDVEEAVGELVDDFGDLSEEYAELQVRMVELNDDTCLAERHIRNLESLLETNHIEFQRYFDVLN